MTAKCKTHPSMAPVFGARTSRGHLVWRRNPPVFADTACYRLLFIEGTCADLGALEMSLTVYQVTIKTTRGRGLTVNPFDGYRRKISSKTRGFENVDEHRHRFICRVAKTGLLLMDRAHVPPFGFPGQR